MVMMMIHDNVDTSTGPWQVSVEWKLEYCFNMGIGQQLMMMMMMIICSMVARGPHAAATLWKHGEALGEATG